ncbi:MAG: DUF2283 domain-containing protein [Deltaproteobacteria bacterium]|nr:DUF2283 domain-containing protein [Deltaproteobacteria bacterium]
MKIDFDIEADVLTIETSKSGKIDHATQMGPAIVHFDRKGKPILIEILDASSFVSEIVKTAMKAKMAA